MTPLEIIIVAKDQASQQLAKVKGALGDLGQKAKEVGSKGFAGVTDGLKKVASFAGTALVSGVVAGGVALGGLGIQAIKTASDFEATQLKYKTVLGSQEKAVERSKELVDFAAKTPFQGAEIAKADLILQNFGIRTKEMLGTIGDASAISGASFADLSLIMGQLSQSKSTQNIRQLAERGIVSFDELKQKGIQFAKDGSVVNSVEETFQAVQDIMKEKFKGGMDALSDTLPGRISTLMDTINIGLGQFAKDSGLLDIAKEAVGSLISILSQIDFKAIGEAVGEGVRQAQPFFEVLKTSFFDRLEFFQNTIWPALQPALIQFGQVFLTQIAPAVGSFVNGVWKSLMDGFSYLTGVIWPLIQPVLIGLGELFMNQIVPPVMELGKSLMELWNVIQPYVIPTLQVLGAILGVFLVGAIIGLGAVFKVLIEGIKIGVDLFVQNIKNMQDNWNKISQALATATTFVQNSWNGLKTGAELVFNSIKDFFQTTWDKAIEMKDGIVGAFNSIGSGMANGLKSALNIAIDTLNRGISSVNGLIASIPEIPGVGTLPQIPQIPKLARGGRVKAGRPYIVGDNPDGSLNRTSELFIPSSSGRVLSADNTRKFLNGGEQGRGGITINIQNLNIKDVQNPQDFARQMRRISRQGLVGFRNGTRTA